MHASRLGQHGAAVTGQLRLSRCVAVEQGHAKLRLEIGYRVADHRGRAIQFSCRPRETADVHDRDEHLQLVERRRAGISDHIYFLEHIDPLYDVLPISNGA